MKVYFNLEKRAITDVDNENQVIFTGDVLTSELQVISNTPTTDYYVTVSAKLSNGRTIGPFLADVGGIITDEHSTTWKYTLSSDNGFTLTKGITNFYIWLMPVDCTNKSQKCLGAVVVNVGEAFEFGDDYFIAVDEEDEEQCFVNMKAQVKQLQQLINSVTTIVANPDETASTDLNKVKIGSVTYRVSYVRANQNNPTGILGALEIDGTNYKVSVVSFEWISHSETELREITLNGNQRHVFNNTDDKPVLYKSQALNSSEKEQARINIGITSALFEGVVTLGYDATTDTYTPTGILDLTSMTKVLVDPTKFKVKVGANEIPLTDYAGAYPVCHKITDGTITLAQLVSSYASGSTLDTCFNYADHLYHIFFINGSTTLTCTVIDGTDVKIYKWTGTIDTSKTLTSICAGTGATESHRLTQKANQSAVDSINAKIPYGASSLNQLATESEITGLDSRLDTIEAAMPNGASSNNKLATMQDIATVYKPKGSVTNYSDLPTTGLTVGDVYNIINADSTHGIKAGENVVWNGTTWDPLGGVVDLSGYQPIIDSSHKLSSDLVSDANNTNKFVDVNKLNVLKATKYLTYEETTSTNISTFVNANFTSQSNHTGSIMCVYADHNTDDRKYAIIFYNGGSLYDTGTLDIIKFYDNDIIKYHWTLTSGLPTMTLIQALAGTNATSSESLKNKVDKEVGKGLSTNDFTTEYKNKIDYNTVLVGQEAQRATTQENKSLYHLGAYDTISGNTITRQTGYVDNLLKNNLAVANLSAYSGTCTQLVIDFTTQDFVSNILIADNEWTSTLYHAKYSNNKLYFNIPLQTSNDNAIAYALGLGITIQYKLATSYTETVIEGQPLNTLDQQGSQWLRKEWEKTLQLWNEECLQGYWDFYSTDVPFTSANNQTCTKDYIEVKPSTTYCVGCQTTITNSVLCYDINKTYIGTVSYNNNVGFTTLANTYFIKINFGTNYGGTYNNDIMLNEGDHPYPYQERYGAIIHEKDIEPTLLWENGSPTSAFAGQTITLSEPITNFKYVVIGYKSHKDATAVIYHKVATGTLGSSSFISLPYLDNFSDRAMTSSRFLSFNANTYNVKFEPAYKDTTEDNEMCVPVAIYGTNIL